MKQIIRFGTFETNSSSTHCMVITTEDKYKRWEAGELIYCEYGYHNIPDKDGFISKKDVIEALDKENNSDRYGDAIYYLMGEEAKMCDGQIEHAKEELDNEGLYTFEQYMEKKGEYLECTDATYTTPSGDKIVVVCHYGYNG